MCTNREIDRLFEWTPPPSTVVRLKSKNQVFIKAAYEMPSSPPSKRPESLNVDGIRKSALRDKNKEGMKEKGSNSGSNRSRNGSEFDKICDTKTGISRTESIAVKPPSFFHEEIIEKTEVKKVEGGNNAYLEALGLLDETSLEGDSTRKMTHDSTVFVDERVGKKPVDVNSLMKSRKKSEFNPTPKFLSLSYQNGIEDNASDAGKGALYAKRFYHDEETDKHKVLKTSRVGSKKKGFLFKKRRDPTPSLQPVGSTNEVDSDQGMETNSINPRRKSVYLQEDIREQPVDIDDLFTRKKSRENRHDQFVSICYESTERMGERARSGGLYAKKLSK
eukprot:gene6031-11405_t